MKVCRVSIIGFPNAGKSTLLSHLVGRRISAISPKKHTTKTVIISSKTIDDKQLIFIDTPGINNNMQRKNLWLKSLGSMKNSNVILYLIDVSKKSLNPEKELWETLNKLNIPTFIIFTKIDHVRKEKLLPLMKYYGEFKNVMHVIPLCLVEENLDVDINSKLLEYSKDGEFEYLSAESGDSSIGDSEKLVELIKESMFHIYHQEIPHQVDIENVKLKGTTLSFDVFAKRQSQKSLLIGKDGVKIQAISNYIKENAKHYNQKVKDVYMRVI